MIMIYLTGGPPHLDMVDLKPDAPSEIRGEFQPISTNVPGIQISELMPRVASMMDKFAIIRSLVGAEERHSSFQCVTGHMFRSQPLGLAGNRLRSVSSAWAGRSGRAARDRSVDEDGAPAVQSARPGFLGMAHTPFKPSGDALEEHGAERCRASSTCGSRIIAGGPRSFRRQADQQAGSRR